MSPLTEPTGPPPGPAGTDRGLRTTTVVVAGPWRAAGRAATMGRMFLIALVVIGSVCGAFALAVIHADRVNKWLWVLPQRLRGRGWGLLLVPLGVAYAMLDRTGHRFVAVAVLAGVLAPILAPRLARKAVPYVVLALTAYGLALAKGYHDGNNQSILYGLVLAGAGSWRTHLVLPQAMLFFAAGLWLLVRVQAPGAGWVHAIAARWRSGARRGILPWQGFLLLPVVVLAMELLGARDWFGVPWMTVPLGVPADLELAERASQLTQRVQALTQTRSDAVDTAVAELRRIERDLHDGAQARLVALGMSLQAAERLFATSPEAALALVTEAKESSSRALTELRDLVRGIYPPVLADRGLGDAIRALALDTPLHTVLDIDLPGEVDMPVAAAVYFSVAEALANVTKHADARSVHIRLSHAAGMLRAEVTDDGAGGADPARGTGLAGVERRLATFDGILAVNSPPGGPTMIVMEVPCALSSPKTCSC